MQIKSLHLRTINKKEREVLQPTPAQETNLNPNIKYFREDREIARHQP